MERKIGEIFELGGEWYQCVKSPDGSCKHCDMNFGGKCPIPIKECVASSRSDLSYVIFKKLEKVGDPLKINGKIYQGLISPYGFNNCSMCAFRNISCKDVISCYDDYIFIEVKQNKEDMEEYKIHDAKEYIPEFDKVVDECLFGKQELKLKPFDLQKAKAGKPVCTRDGRKARIICFDAKRKNKKCIIALVPSKDYPGFEGLMMSTRTFLSLKTGAYCLLTSCSLKTKSPSNIISQSGLLLKELKEDLTVVPILHRVSIPKNPLR